MRIYLLKNYLKKIYRSSSRMILTLSGLVLSVIILMSVLIISETLLAAQMQSVNIYKECNGVVADCELDYDTYEYFKNNEAFNMYMELSPEADVNLKNIFLENGDSVSIYGRCIKVDENWHINLLPQGDYYDIERYRSELIQGRLIDSKDIENGEKVIVIDSVTAQILFGKAEAVGEIVNLETANEYGQNTYEKYKVIGVIEASVYAEKQYDSILEIVKSRQKKKEELFVFNFYVPYTCKYGNYNVESYRMQLIFTSNTKEYTDIKKDINYEKMGTELKINQVVDADVVYEQNAQQIAETQNMIMYIMIVVFIISGLCIMNTMMFSIKERINEIGIRKAIGAFNNDILIQFVFEGFVYGLFSGIIGVMFSVIIWSHVYIMSEDLFIGAEKLVISVEAVILSIVSAILVSILASIIPAIYASKIKVSNALKFD